MRWEDNIREWTDLEFGKSQRAVENREKWRKLVAKSSVVPQRPLRLRDRWRRRRWWWWWWWWHRMQSYGLRLQRHVSSEGFWPRSRLIELIIPFALLGDVDSSQLTTRECLILLRCCFVFHLFACLPLVFFSFGLRGLTFTWWGCCGLWWGCCGLCLWHKLTELAHSFFFYSVLVSVFVFVALSIVFLSINSPDNSPLSHSVLPVLMLPY